ncbi:AAA family ATPase [Streptomyces goshikiensis]|uniref:AAA family ATPase n=1 Tax=Streptomyces goshikiensis TaxID=1942 RepID=UPI003681AEDB
MIVALGGRPRTGKTALARALAQAIPGILLDKAELRRVLFPKLATTSPEQNDRLNEWLLQAAVWHLETIPGSVVVLDGRPLTRLRDVEALRRFAYGIGHALHIVECVCPIDVSVARADARAAASQDRDPIADLSQEAADPIPEPKIVVDTLLPPARCLGVAIEGITRQSTSGRPETSGPHHSFSRRPRS